MSDKIQLNVGYVGATREGKRVEIVNCTHDNIYSWRGNNNETYTHWGSFSSNRNDARDIVGPWVKPLTDYNDGNWHQWSSDKCPVHERSFVECVWHHEVSGATGITKRIAGGDSKDYKVLWRHVIKFRVTKEYNAPVAPREFWVYNGSVSWGIKTEKPDDMYGYIHVREVVE
jgi:hypothetical protein